MPQRFPQNGHADWPSTIRIGGKAYGVEFVDKEEVEYIPPLRESMPPIPEPWASNIFYYAQFDLMGKLSDGKS